MEIITESAAVTTTGTDASATGSATIGALQGFLLDIYLDYSGDAPNTTDVTIAHARTPSENIIVVSNNATDGHFPAALSPVTATAGSITDAHRFVPLNGPLTVSVAGADALAPCVTAYVTYLRL